MFNFVGTPIRLDFEVRDEDDILTNAATTTFWWRIGKGGTIVKADTPVHDGLGLYHVIFTPDRGGTLYWRFTSDTPTVVSDGRAYIEPAEFDEDATWGNSQWV